MWVELLLLEAEALNLVEVLPGLERDHIVCTDACHWLGCWVLSCVKC